jgi:hypothetical protein
MSQNGHRPTVETILRDFRRDFRTLPLAEQKRLARALGEELGSWTTVPRALLDFFPLAIAKLTAFMKWLAHNLTEQSNLAWAAQRGNRRKAELLARRHQAIDKAREVGITDTQAIFSFLRDNHPELIRKGKGFVDPISIMRTYQKSKKARG